MAPKPRAAEAGTRSWVRVRLTDTAQTSQPALTEGELILRADTVAQLPDAVVFLVGDEEVFRLERCYYRTHAWFVDRPTFAEWLRQRRAHHPQQGRVWTPEEIARLKEATAGPLTRERWERAAAEFGRSVTAVRTKAAWLRRLDDPAFIERDNARAAG
jgi:hypothetical protein